jgi:hypothetical protein
MTGAIEGATCTAGAVGKGGRGAGGAIGAGEIAGAGDCCAKTPNDNKPATRERSNLFIGTFPVKVEVHNIIQ